MEAGSQRPSVDLIVPFVGAAEELSALATRLKHLALGAADTLAIVDNRPPGAPDVEVKGLRVLRAPERQSSYYARNRGAVIGTNAWLVFLDADVEPPTDLIDRYFITAAGERAGVLAGGVVDESLDTHAPRSAAARYTMLRASMSQSNTLGGGRWAYAQTANCAVRRAAFAEVGGFRDDVRSGGDADLCFRLAAAGWQLESRPGAAVLHHNRVTVPRMLAQRARHNAGGRIDEVDAPFDANCETWVGSLALREIPFFARQ